MFSFSIDPAFTENENEFLKVTQTPQGHTATGHRSVKSESRESIHDNLSNNQSQSEHELWDDFDGSSTLDCLASHHSNTCLKMLGELLITREMQYT